MQKLFVFLFFSIVMGVYATNCGGTNKPENTLPIELQNAFPAGDLGASQFNTGRFMIASPADESTVVSRGDVRAGMAVIISPHSTLERLRYAVDGTLAPEDSPPAPVDRSLVNIFYCLDKLAPGTHTVEFWLKFKGDPHFYTRSARFTR